MAKKKFNCPAEMTVSLIGGKWRAILLYNLRRGPLRFGELRRRSPGITPATLAQQLRLLETSGLVSRRAVGREALAGVEYRLTERGESLRPVINALIRWGVSHREIYTAGDFGMAVFQK